MYISGESGTGKELVAKLIHEKGPRAAKPFVPINCGAIPSELLESELFGHLKGSFTGAVSDKKGLFQTANGGTLFLDEIADLPLHMQVKLLRAIQEKSVRPVGGDREIPIDVRILSATHKNLSNLVNDGQFRQDLFYRINVIELPLPSLRSRTEDIPVLTNHILGKLAASFEEYAKEPSKEALKKLKGYAYPGNVRELENILERALTLCETADIIANDIHLPEGAQNLHEQSFSTDSVQLEDYLDTLEKQAIVEALEKTKWNKTAAAKELGITFRALRYRLKKLDLDD